MIQAIEKQTCRRCGRPFTPRKSDQAYGEKCLRIMAGQTVLQDRYVVPPRKKKTKKGTLADMEVMIEKGKVVEVIV